MFYFPIADTTLLNSRAIRAFAKEKGPPERAARKQSCFYRCWTHLPPAAFSHCCWIIQLLLPKVWLYLAAPAPEEQSPLALQVEVAPKLKLHLSESSWPLVSNHAFRSGSVMASNCSCESTLIRPSAPPTPADGLLGPVDWISQPLGQRSGLPTKAYLISTPPSVAWVWKPQYCVQNPEVSLMFEEVSTIYMPLALRGRAPLLRTFATVVCRLESLRLVELLTVATPPRLTLPLTLPVVSP